MKAWTVWVLLALSLAACAGPSKPSTVRRVGDLPPEYRELWLAWLDEAPDWRQQREAALADPELVEFLVDNLAREMLRGYGEGDIATHASEAHGTFERAQAELIVLGGVAVPTVAELFVIGNGATYYLCGDLLVDIGRPALPYVVGLLEREEEQARRRAAELLGRLPHGLDEERVVRDALIERVAHDPGWIVRKSAAESLARRGERDAVTEPSRRALTQALGDEDPAVAATAALGLGVLDDPAAIPALVNFLYRASRGDDLPGYRAAQRSLRSLSRTQEDRHPEEWRDWWRQNRSTLNSEAKKATGPGNGAPPRPTIPAQDSPFDPVSGP